MSWKSLRIRTPIAEKLSDFSIKAGKSQSEFLSDLLKSEEVEGKSVDSLQSSSKDLGIGPSTLPSIPDCFYADTNESNPLFVKCFYRFGRNLKTAVVPIDECEKHLQILEEIRASTKIKSREQLQTREENFLPPMKSKNWNETEIPPEEAYIHKMRDNGDWEKR